MRVINGDEVLRIFKLWIDTKQVEGEELRAVETCIAVIEDMPTLTPPNESRMINADKLAKRIAGHSNYHGDSILAAIYCATEGKENDVPIQPIETPPNEWVSVEDTVPTDDENGLEFFCMTNAMGKCGGVLPLEWEVTTVRGKTVRRWKWFNKISPWRVTHWMKRPAPPKKEE